MNESLPQEPQNENAAAPETAVAETATSVTDERKPPEPMWKKTLKFLLLGRIIEMHLANIGVKDFLKGPDVFTKEDIAKVNNGELITK